MRARVGCVRARVCVLNLFRFNMCFSLFPFMSAIARMGIFQVNAIGIRSCMSSAYDCQYVLIDMGEARL